MRAHQMVYHPEFLPKMDNVMLNSMLQFAVVSVSHQQHSYYLPTSAVFSVSTLQTYPPSQASILWRLIHNNVKHFGVLESHGSEPRKPVRALVISSLLAFRLSCAICQLSQVGDIGIDL